MKKLAAIVVFLISFSISGEALAVGATLSLSPAAGSFNRSCQTNLDIILDTGGVQTGGTDAILIYDPSRFTIKSIKNGTTYSDYPGNVIDPAQGKVVISGISSSGSSFSGNGILATLVIEVNAAAPTGVSQIKFDFDPNDKAKTGDSNVADTSTDDVHDLLNQVVDGSYTVGTGACGSSSLTPTPAGGGTVPVTQIPEEKKPLPGAGTFETTMIITIAGGFLTVLGIIGLAFL